MQILLNFSPDTSYKWGRFFKTLIEKIFEFVLDSKDNTITFNLSFVLLLANINLISEKHGYKKDALMYYSFDYVNMVLALLTKIVTFYIQAFIGIS